MHGIQKVAFCVYHCSLMAKKKDGSGGKNNLLAGRGAAGASGAAVAKGTYSMSAERERSSLFASMQFAPLGASSAEVKLMPPAAKLFTSLASQADKLEERAKISKEIKAERLLSLNSSISSTLASPM